MTKNEKWRKIFKNEKKRENFQNDRANSIQGIECKAFLYICFPGHSYFLLLIGIFMMKTISDKREAWQGYLFLPKFLKVLCMWVELHLITLEDIDGGISVILHISVNLITMHASSGVLWGWFNCRTMLWIYASNRNFYVITL